MGRGSREAGEKARMIATELGWNELGCYTISDLWDRKEDKAG